MERDDRAQSGLDRLMLFVLVLIVVVAAIPFVLGLGGVDVRAPQNDTAETANQPTDLVVLGATGEATTDGVGVVRVVVTKNGTGETIDAASVVGTWTDGGAYTLTSDGATANGSAVYGLSVDGPSDSGTRLAATGDRATYTFDLGGDDVDGVPEFGRELRPGETVTLSLTTPAGKTTEVTIVVSENPDSGDAVTLRRLG
jgi:hypothetical protein